MKKLFTIIWAVVAITTTAGAKRTGYEKLPAPGSENVNVDTRLTLVFDEGVTPAAGTSGMIRIIDLSTGEVADSLDMSIPAGPVESTKLPKALYTLKPYVYTNPTERPTNRNTIPGTPSGTAVQDTSRYQRTIIGGFTDAFHFYPIIVHGNRAEIYPHNNMLDYGHTYGVEITKGALTANGKPVVVKPSDWTFTVRPAAPEIKDNHITVAADGSADFNTVQGAMDFIPDFNTEPWTVSIRNGEYEELVYFRNKRNVTIEGESREGVYIHYPNNEVFNPHPADVSTNEWLGTFPSRRAPFMMDNSTDMTLRNFTVATDCRGQAEGLLIAGERNLVENVSIIGDGDALQVNGSCYLKNCSIDGGGDTVLGRGPAMFVDCTLTSRGPFAWIRNGSASHGDVFVDCTFIGKGDGAVLARTNGTYPHCEMVLIDCRLENIPALGWGGIERGPADYVRYWEFNSRNLSDGLPADVSQRAEGSAQLNAETDAELIRAYRDPMFVLGWNPFAK